MLLSVLTLMLVQDMTEEITIIIEADVVVITEVVKAQQAHQPESQSTKVAFTENYN